MKSEVNVSDLLDYVIGSIRFGGFQPSKEQVEKLKEALPELTGTTTKEQKKEQFKAVSSRLDAALRLEGISTKSPQQREDSIKQIEEALVKLRAIEADTATVEFLSECTYHNVSKELRLAREKMENLLRRLREGESFSSSGPVGGISSHYRRLTRGTHFKEG